MKIVIAIALITVLLALGSAGFFMLRRPGGAAGRDSRMAWALALRVGVSVLLFAFIWFAYWMGWIQPSGLPR